MTTLAQQINEILSEGGITQDAEWCWWGACRDELDGRAPFAVAMAEGEACAEQLLELARADMLAATLADHAAEELETYQCETYQRELHRWEGSC